MQNTGCFTLHLKHPSGQNLEAYMLLEGYISTLL